MVNLREAERTKGIVAGEEFITPIATEGDGDFRPRKPAEQPSREERAVTLRFIQSIKNLRQRGEGPIEAQRVNMMVRFKKIGDSSGEDRLVERWLAKTDGECLQAMWSGLPASQRRDGGGIQAST